MEVKTGMVMEVAARVDVEEEVETGVVMEVAARVVMEVAARVF